MNSDYDKLSHKDFDIAVVENGNLKVSTTYTRDNDVESLSCTTSSGSSVREKWGKEVEFVFSCIALSVGLGNVWRFPFIALANGGGAFLVPYIIVLLLIGRPIYYMEIVIGQFSSSGCIKAFNMVPLMKGVAYGQVYATAWATTYYASIMALTIKYLLASFAEVLPWTYCRPEWNNTCVATAEMKRYSNETLMKQVSSTELFFSKTVLHEKDSIANGLGELNWDLVFCLLIAWIIIGTILIKGIRSSGKASYFLALFPYVVMLILFFRAVTLPGSVDGIVYFLKPQWDKLMSPKVWYAAITQMFFSLAICFGTLVMYASYNNFTKTIYKDVIIITTVDSFTSILAGCIIFGILGNLAYETNADDISTVVRGGTGLAFISYPEAIAKFKYLPQAYAVLFFLMLLVLGIGSNIGMASCVITVIKDCYSHVPHWMLSCSVTVIGFLCGLIYMTPGGQFIVNLVDFFGCSFIALFLAIAELVAVSWIYGVKRFCGDIEFMLNIKTGFYWRICWAVITPGLMFVVLIYTLVTYEPLTYNGAEYPELAYILAWFLWAVGVGQLPLWAIYVIYKQPGNNFTEKLKQSMRPTKSWGPLESKTHEEYLAHIKSFSSKAENVLWTRIHENIFG